MIKVIRIIVTTISLYLITHLFVFIFLPIILIISYVYPNKIQKLKRWFVKCIFIIVGKRVRVIGSENINPDHKYIIVSNYPSGYTGFSLIGQFPDALIVAHTFLKRIPLISQVLQRVGVIFVKSGSKGHGQKAIDIYIEKRTNISSLFILPEGGITRDGKIHRFKRGFVYIQRKTLFDILPVTLNGFYQFKPFGRIYADPDAILEMVVHPEISSSNAIQMGDDELINKVKDTIERVYRP